MDEGTLRRLRDELTEDRDQQLAVLAEHGADPYSEDVGDLHIDGDGFADAAQATEERAEILGQLEFARQRVRDIDRALGRMDDGSYGTCVDCDEPIASERLEVRPLSVRCVRCASAA